MPNFNQTSDGPAAAAATMPGMDSITVCEHLLNRWPQPEKKAALGWIGADWHSINLILCHPMRMMGAADWHFTDHPHMWIRPHHDMT
jgi:hypothetical protein